MSRRHALRQRLRVYGELRQIMGAMKNIALMELHRLAGLIETQRELLGAYEQAAAEFFATHPELLPPTGDGPALVIAVGSERGFCGDFNEAVLRALEETRALAPAFQAVLVGGRLAQRAAALTGAVAVLQGPAMIEEVRPAIHRLLEAVGTRPDLAGAFSLHGLAVLHHRHTGETSRVRLYRPREALRPAGGPRRRPARIGLPPRVFAEELIEHYLHAVLYSVFYDSLAAENHRRVAHMQAALDRLDERIAAGRLRLNTLRQEEITEQIEEIMLTAEALLPGVGAPR